MEFNRLRSFAAVAEAGHLTRAAEKLHISQPALSAQIKSLEDELDVLLFDRTPGGMVLTPAGRQLLAHAQKVLSAAQVLQAEARALKGEVSGKATVGSLSDPEFIRLGDFMTSAMERYPLLEIEFKHEITGVALGEVRSGALDGSFYYGDLHGTGVSAIALREIGYRLAAPAEWGARIQDAPWEEVIAEPWIMPPEVSSHRQLAASMFRAHGAAPTRLIVADHEAVVSSLVASGLGVALIREEVAQRMAAAGEIYLWRDVRVATTMWFIYLQARENDPVVKALLEVIGDLWHPGQGSTAGEGAGVRAPLQLSSAVARG
ncbi:MAG: LysR family transcriptional regulator [Betaproteobacteria bacterium]